MVSLDLEPWKRRKMIPSGTITEFNFGLCSNLFGLGYDFHIFLFSLCFFLGSFSIIPQRSHMSFIPHFPYYPQYRLLILLYPFHFNFRHVKFLTFLALFSFWDFFFLLSKLARSRGKIIIRWVPPYTTRPASYPLLVLD